MDTAALPDLAGWCVAAGRSLPDPSVAAIAARVCVRLGSLACATRLPSSWLHRMASACIAHPTSASAADFPHFLPLAHDSNSIGPGPTVCIVGQYSNQDDLAQSMPVSHQWSVFDFFSNQSTCTFNWPICW